ncbi:hypothetical protein CYMTET_25368 [Cymbomonas tetramitiformis]|uniref:Uncharacterized protein n=1 Tax=Cymbomonas tetramitiformis TaxID=36881 RepID=A0AAE0KZB1_9CHLO|nr:hypothetical protein CYMTET_25368 [Cymbomonas tetramitiformis]
MALIRWLIRAEPRPDAASSAVHRAKQIDTSADPISAELQVAAMRAALPALVYTRDMPLAEKFVRSLAALEDVASPPAANTPPPKADGGMGGVTTPAPDASPGTALLTELLMHAECSIRRTAYETVVALTVSSSDLYAPA